MNRRKLLVRSLSLSGVLSILAAAALAILAPSLPDAVAVQWGSDGEVTNTFAPQLLPLFLIGTAVIPIVVTGLIAFNQDAGKVTAVSVLAFGTGANAFICAAAFAIVIPQLGDNPDTSGPSIPLLAVAGCLGVLIGLVVAVIAARTFRTSESPT